VFLGVSHISNFKVTGHQRPQKFWGPSYVYPYGMTHSNQILHDDQTSTAGLYRVDYAPGHIDLQGRIYGAIPLRCQTLCNMTLKQHNAGVHCNKKPVNGIKLCLSFSQGLKFQAVYF